MFIFISTQKDQFISEVDLSESNDILFCSDSLCEIGKKLSILNKFGTPFGAWKYSRSCYFPTIIITDKTDNILYSHSAKNFRLLPHPNTIIKKNIINKIDDAYKNTTTSDIKLKEELDSILL